MPFGALAHEMGHSFQFLVNADGAWALTSSPKGSGGQTFFEMSSQYMLWHVYPDWMTFENYHLKAYLKQTNYAFLHEANQYHSPYVLEYWSEKHGIRFIGKLWNQALKGEDPVMAYKRITKINQSEFNDEMHQAACKFITWDLSQAKLSAKAYDNKQTVTLDTLGKGWNQISRGSCPQNYGYNGIRLKTPPGGTKIKVDFEGIAGNEGFRKVNLNYAGWRYSFVAWKKNGQRVYGKIHSDPVGSVSFTVPKETAELWLVVTGAPTTHWEHLSDGKEENDEQWPYKIKLLGTSLAL